MDNKAWDKRRNDRASAVGESVINGGARLKGDLHVDGPLRVSGTIEGNLVSSDKIEIEHNGTVRGDIKAQEVHVSGVVVGRLDVPFVHIAVGARLEGELTTSRLIVDNGARFDGSCNMAPKVAKHAVGEGRDAVASAEPPGNDGARKGGGRESSSLKVVEGRRK